MTEWIIFFSVIAAGIIVGKILNHIINVVDDILSEDD